MTSTAHSHNARACEVEPLTDIAPEDGYQPPDFDALVLHAGQVTLMRSGASFDARTEC